MLCRVTGVQLRLTFSSGSGLESLDAEIGELLSGTMTGRSDDRQITLYRSVGVAVQDAAAAGLVLREAQRQGVGTVLALEGIAAAG